MGSLSCQIMQCWRLCDAHGDIPFLQKSPLHAGIETDSKVFEILQSGWATLTSYLILEMALESFRKAINESGFVIYDIYMSSCVRSPGSDIGSCWKNT